MAAPVEPIEFRLARRLNLSPIVLGTLITAGALLLMWTAYSLSGIALLTRSTEADGMLTPQAHAALLAAILLGYCGGATAYLSRGTSVWRLGDLAGSRWVGLAGVATGLLVSALTIGGIRAFEPGRPLMTLGEWLLNATFLILFWTLGRAGYFAVASILRPRAIAAIDIYDLRPLYRHGHDQLRIAMIWLVGVSLFVLIMFFDPNPAIQTDSALVVAPLLSASLVIGVAMILLPLRQVWMSIRSAKAEALAAVADELKHLRSGPPAPPGREADLLARRFHLSEISEWPFDASSAGTFTFYVLVPFLTWITATLAKRLFDTVFMERLVEGIVRQLGG